MKPNELRKGNLLRNNKNILVVVDSIVGKCINIQGAYDVGCIDFEYKLKDLDPVVLTEDWLIKLGFMNNVLFLNKSYKLIIENETHYERSVYLENAKASIPLLLPVKYVHQLQNLYFALTGEELTLK